MSAIRERTELAIVDLPEKLLSRRNLLAHFSNFGEVKNVNVNKKGRCGLINFSNHFDAQTAKEEGQKHEGKVLKIFWSDFSTLDPRSKEMQDYVCTETDQLWQDDDKECFGVQFVHSGAREERKQSANEMIKQHLKVPENQKKKSVIAQKADVLKIPERLNSPLPKLSKISSKTQGPLKKNLLIHEKKRKVIRKEKLDLHSKVSLSAVSDESSNITGVSMLERTDLKQKLVLLDERDKLIRKETVQHSDIKTVVSTKGTCPDMCPERERIVRQCQHAVAYYEKIPGTNEMDENRAVKEYSRSSADQEVPLPHDLRPLPVLSMTMSYLITNIINRIDNPAENKALWYSFCWNRLRCVRKDIIMQELCDLDTVIIVEQCARFHISCFDHMLGAEVGGFDDKNNTRNLINCLQSLRHMYEDLAKHNVVCPNEAEFYSYLILLKLKSGDVMWEYQQYSLEIQLSPHVQFAIEAYMAFKNNMYSRYFSLVKKASYLTACLMQRYFDEIRTRALKTMVKAYGLPGKNVGLSSSFVVSSLKFDSQKNALMFCEKEGVTLKVDSDGYEHDVCISTSSFLIREKRIPITIAVVGEGNRVPVYVPHQVHSSFDESGRLKQTLSAALKEENVTEMSDESVFSDDDKPEVNVSQSNASQSSFNFSLDPSSTASFGTKFSSSQVKNEYECNGSLNKKTESHTNVDNENCKGFREKYKDRNIIDPSKTEEAFEEDMIFEENKMQHETHEYVQKSCFSSQSNTCIKSQFHIKEPFLSSFSPLSKAPTFFSKGLEKGSVIISHGNRYIKDNHEENKKFSLFCPENVSNKIFVDNTVNNKIECNSYKLKDNKQSLFSFDACKPQKPEIKQKEHEAHDSNTYIINLKLSQEKLNSSITKADTIDSVEVSNQNEKMTRMLELQNMLMKNAEDEKLKMEEIKRSEMLRLKKSIAKKKELENLKKDLRQRLKAISARKYAQQWRKKVEKIREIRAKYGYLWKEKVEKVKRTRADFPMLIQLSVNEHLLSWGSIQSAPTNRVLKRAKEKRKLIKMVPQLLLSGVSGSCKYIGFDVAEVLAKSAAKTMKKGVVKPVYWKLAISVPWSTNATSELSVFNTLMKKWTKESFYRNPHACLGSVETVMSSLEIPVKISIHFSDNLQSSVDLQALDALIFVVLNESETEKICLQRLRALATCQVKNARLSVAVMNIVGCTLDRVLKMELQELQEQNFIANWTVNKWANPDCIIDSLNLLASNVITVPQFCANPLELLVKDVSEEFFDALNSGLYTCRGLMEAMKHPNNIISLFNTCLTKLENLLINRDVENDFSFPEDLKMHDLLNDSNESELMYGIHYSNLYRAQISKKLESLKLPEFTKWPPMSPNRLMKMLKTYCSQVHDLGVFPQIIRMLDLPDDSDIKKHLHNVSWLNIVEIWAQCSVRHNFSTREKKKQMFVIFNKNNVQRMIQKQWWLKHPVVLQQNRC